MSLLANLRKKQFDRLATAIPAISATQAGWVTGTVARIATVAVANPTEAKTTMLEIVGSGDTATQAEILERHPDAVAAEPFDREAFEERAAICEFDGGLSREEAEAIAWREDDRRRCAHCLNIRPGGFCKVATPGGLVSAVKGYRPDQAILQRCAGYRPCPDDPDQRPGRERWPGLIADRGDSNPSTAP